MPATATARPSPPGLSPGLENSEFLNILRGLVLFGILPWRFMGLAFPASIGLYPEAAFPSWPDRLAALVYNCLFRQAFPFLFILLLGLTFCFSLWPSAKDPGSAAPRYWRRTIFLLAVGLLDALLAGWGALLALAALLAVPLATLGQSDRKGLLLWCLVFYWMTPAALLAIALAGPGWPPYPGPLLTHPWTFESLLDAFWPSRLDLTRQMGSALALALPRLFATVLVGGYLWRSNFLGTLPARTRGIEKWTRLLTGLGLGCAAGAAAIAQIAPFASRGIVVAPFARTLGPVAADTLAACAAPLLAGGIAGMVLTGLRNPVWGPRLRAFASTGRLPVTGWLLQSIAGFALVWPLAWAGALRPSVLLPLSLALFPLQAVFSRWWIDRYRGGPLEWAWRCFADLRLHPFRRPAG